MLTMVTKARESGVVNFCLRTSKVYGEHVYSFKGYMSVQGTLL